MKNLELQNLPCFEPNEDLAQMNQSVKCALRCAGLKVIHHLLPER